MLVWTFLGELLDQDVVFSMLSPPGAPAEKQRNRGHTLGIKRLISALYETCSHVFVPWREERGSNFDESSNPRIGESSLDVDAVAQRR